MKILFQNNGVFSTNRIEELVKIYTDPHRGEFYNFGWGNIGIDMIKYDFPSIKINKGEVNCYGNPRGNIKLIDEIVKFIQNKSRVKVKNENIIITNGATNAIFLLSCFFRKFLKIDKILIQNPTYDTAINIFKSQDYKLVTVDPTFLNFSVNKNIKLSYLMFKLHNPTGISIDENKSKEIKNKLLKIGYVIEDDAYGLFDGKDKLNIMDNKKYIYVGSFSKYIFPGIRLGYIIADKDIISKLALMQKYYNSHPNILSQLTLLHYLKTQKIEREINYKINLLNQKRKLFEKFLSPEIKKNMSGSRTGFYYWITLPSGMKSQNIFLLLLKRGVFVIPGDIYFTDEEHSYGALRVSISSIPEGKVQQGARLLGEYLLKYVF